MDNRKLLLTLNALVCVLILLHIYTLAGATSAVTNTATGGAVDSTISVNLDPETANRSEVIERAVHRGYYTASEFAIFEGVDKRTIYRRLDSGVIDNARKVDGHWRIFCN